MSSFRIIRIVAAALAFALSLYASMTDAFNPLYALWVYLGVFLLTEIVAEILEKVKTKQVDGNKIEL